MKLTRENYRPDFAEPCKLGKEIETHIMRTKGITEMFYPEE